MMMMQMVVMMMMNGGGGGGDSDGDGGGGGGGDSDGDCDGGDGDGARSPKENIFQVFCRQRLASKESFLIRFQMEFALELLIKGEHSLNH